MPRSGATTALAAAARGSAGGYVCVRRMRDTGLAERGYVRLAASSWSAIRGTAVPIGSRMRVMAAVS